MYIPSHFSLEDVEQIRALMLGNPFATLVTNVDGQPFATHLPLLVEGDTELVLAGHVAKSNPHWKSFDGQSSSLAIFHGPHAYISPRLYESRPNVPTWNYATVHAYGRPEIISDPEEALAHVLKVVQTFDPGLADEQPESFEESYLRKMVNGIVTFRMPVERLEGKLKMNQNKIGADRAGVIRALRQSPDEMERAVGRLMPDA